MVEVKKGIELLLNNSGLLVNEASILFNHNHLARAYTLAHICTEEMSKISMLFRIGILLRINGEIDWKSFWIRYKNHKYKLINNSFWVLTFAQFVDGFDDEWYIQNSNKVIDKKNDRKNDSLYVGFNGTSFSEPDTAITKAQSEREVTLAKLTLKMIESMREKIFEFLDKNKKEILELYEANGSSGTEIIEFMNYYEDIITSVAKKCGNVIKDSSRSPIIKNIGER